jgi:transposase-like protein
VPEQRRKFSPQFKAEAVLLVIETGKPIAEVARDLGVNDGTLGNWVKAWRDAHPEPVPELSPVERARMKELEEENRRLRLENEFLKKPRPSSLGRLSSGALRAHRGGEGHLSDHVHVPAARRGPLELLRLAAPGGVPDRGATAGVGRACAAGV